MADTGETQALSLRELRLKPGLLLQVQTAGGRGGVIECKFCAAIDGKGLMLTLAGAGDLDNVLRAGEKFVVRGFTGQYDFQFDAAVLQTFKVPFVYALFSYPGSVQAKAVRNAMRIAAGLPAMALRRGSTNGVTATLVDLSVAGAMIESPQALGAEGDTLDLMFSIDFEGKKTPVALPSTICHSKAMGKVFRVGVSFSNVSRNDKLLLNYFTLSAGDGSAVV